MAGVVIDCVKEFKFLGCIVDPNLCWSAHTNFISKKIAQVIALLKCFLQIPPLYVKRKIYFAFIYPHLTLCLVTWGSVANKCAHT